MSEPPTDVFSPAPGATHPPAPEPSPEPRKVIAAPVPALADRTFPNLTPLFMVLAGLMMSGLIISFPGLTYTVNDASRWNTVYYLVEHGTYRYKMDHGAGWNVRRRDVDPEQVTPEERAKLIKVTMDGETRYFRDGELLYMPLFPTIDMIKIGENYYSSKPPLLPTIMAGIVIGIEKTSALLGRVFHYPGQTDSGPLGPIDFRTHPWAIIRTTLILLQVVPLMIFIGLMGRWIMQRTENAFVRVFCLVAAAMGTYLTPWTVTLNNHVIGAFCVLFGLYPALKVWYEGRREWYWFALAGFFSSLAATNELPALMVTATVLLALGIRDWKRTVLIALPLAILPLASLAYTNYLVTGSWRPAYEGFGRVGGPYDYEGSYWPPRGKPKGIDALNEPSSVYLTNILIGHHGFFLLTPIFLISFLGVLRQFTGRRDTRPLLALFTLTATAVLVWFYTFFTSESKNYGGTTQGARWLFWLIPLWLLMLPAGVEPLARSRLGRGVCCVLLGVSMISVGCAIRQPWGASWAHLLWRALGIIDY